MKDENGKEIDWKKELEEYKRMNDLFGKSDVCSHCGRCPHCGRHDWPQLPYIPVPYYVPLYTPPVEPYWSDTTIIC